MLPALLDILFFLKPSHHQYFAHNGDYFHHDSWYVINLHWPSVTRSVPLILSITDLTLDARLLYASNSITDILGYQPNEVVGKSCWEYFHPDEIPFARAIHGRGVQLDKAAVLNYCQIKNRDGRWVGCECVFTIVHDVMVGCTSIYKNGANSQSKCNFNAFGRLRETDPLHRTGYGSSCHSAALLIVAARSTVPHAFLHFT